MANLEILNLVPKFLKFFELANQEYVNESERWNLWKEHYNFAALPPGYDQQARKQLNQTWMKYQSNINQIRNWSPDQINIESFFAEIKTLLGSDEDIPFVIVFFVSAFDNSAFVAPYDEHKSMLCLPIENQLSDIIVVHELTHIVHATTASLEMNWERPVAELMLQEGLALHVSKYLVPGKNDEEYIEMGVEQGWLQSCHKHRTKILNGITPYLSDSKGEVIEKFTFGTGASGHKREAYYAGWELVGAELKRGVSFKQLASITPKDIPGYVKNNLK
ncbi:MAG TPA: hypothetical protein VK105_00355 [Virgibacillus sp.]|nr:hypothetical protein [Virgibacillus sp.]HLR65574.1 hypothetical protein [Virgibacillus sp.]